MPEHLRPALLFVTLLGACSDSGDTPPHTAAPNPFADPANAPRVTTPFYAMPDFIDGACTVDDNGVSYLQAMALTDPTDPRADDFNGEFIGGDGWGLHLVDMTLTLGDLVALGAQQAEAWLQDR
ncbi:MAG: hypothetical protein R3E54_16145 [Halioglobus sp.]